MEMMDGALLGNPISQWLIALGAGVLAVIVLRGEGLAGGLNDTDPQATGVPPLPLRVEDRAQEKTVELLNAFLGAASEMLKDEPAANAITMRGIDKLEPMPTVADRAVVRADGPGRGTTRNPSSCTRLTRMAPGSEIPGVPASLTRAIFLPCRSAAISSLLFSASFSR